VTRPVPVLVVDDDSAMNRTLADILRTQGYAPETAVSAAAGLVLAERRTPALAIIDLGLPDMDGMQLATRLQDLSGHTEIIVLTGNATMERAIAALRGNSLDFLIKPVDVEHLLRRARLASERWQQRQRTGKNAAGIAHDISNLLHVISGFADGMRHQLHPEHHMQGDIAEIRKAVERGVRLTRQLMEFGLASGRQREPLQLSTVVDDMRKMLRQIVGPYVDVRLSLDSALPMIEADRGQVEQVIMNLCINARDAMPAGGVLTIKTAKARTDGLPGATGVNGHCAMLAVSDTGYGMSAETQKHIFEPYFTTKTAEKGTGLGLTTVYEIVTKGGGAITVRSVLGEGTTFQILFPFAATT